MQINHRWVVTGLTPGTTYKWWLGAKVTSGPAGVLRWGGIATAEYPPFIMKIDFENNIPNNVEYLIFNQVEPQYQMKINK